MRQGIEWIDTRICMYHFWISKVYSMLGYNDTTACTKRVSVVVSLFIMCSKKTLQDIKGGTRICWLQKTDHKGCSLLIWKTILMALFCNQNQYCVLRRSWGPTLVLHEPYVDKIIHPVLASLEITDNGTPVWLEYWLHDPLQPYFLAFRS